MSLKSFFPYFQSPLAMIYLDTAASSHKLGAVVDAEQSFLRESYASVHRAAYHTATYATREYERVRSKIAAYLSVNDNEVIFSSGATESLNIIANGLHPDMLQGSRIAICASEHHANLLPWQRFAKRHGYHIEVLKLGPNGEFNELILNQWLRQIDEECALLVCAHVSNVLGSVYPVERLCQKAREHQAISVIDGTQALAHVAVNIPQIGCDFYVFSGHKMYANTGVGALIGKYHLLEQMEAYKLGGEMLQSASYTQYESLAPPLKFEAGTSNISAVIGLAHSLDFLANHLTTIMSHEAHLFSYLLSALSRLPDIRILGQGDHNVALISFVFLHRDNHEIAIRLWQSNIALRFGHHCAMPLLLELGVDACLRVSLGAYTDKQDVDCFLRCLREILQDEFSGNESLTNDFENKRKMLLKANDWASVNRALMLISQELPLLPLEGRTSESKIHGCESQVWISKGAEQEYLAYSDSKTVRGILAILLYHAKQDPCSLREELNRYNINKYFSAGRRDGVSAIIDFLQTP